MQATRISLTIVLMLLMSPRIYTMNTGEDFIRAGESFVHRMDYDQAIYFFSRAIEDDPNSVEALLHRGKTYILKDKYQAAMDDYRKALELDPEYVMQWFRKNRAPDAENLEYMDPGNRVSKEYNAGFLEENRNK
jgi:tetratricopeptide (TPR) repeat protein